MISTKQRLESLLNDWQAAGLPCNTQPRVIKELAEGLSNHSFLLEADEQRWVLRLDSPGSESLGVNRDREYRIHQLVATAGLAPTCLKADQKRGYFITEYVEQEPSFKRFSPREQLDYLYTFFTKLHKLSLDMPPFDYLAQLNRLSKNSALSSELVQALKHLESDGNLSVCHHDPNPDNVMFRSEKVIMIDWEYAALGNPVMDLAGLIHDWPFSTQDVSQKFDVDPVLLDAGVTIYAAMNRYWPLEVERLGNL